MPLPMYQKNTRTQDIQLHAYWLWELAGKPEGRSLEFWLRAEEAYDRERIYFADRPNPNFRRFHVADR